MPRKLLLPSVLLLAACSGDRTSRIHDAAPETEASAQEPAATPVAPISTRGQPSAPGSRIVAAGLAFTLPDGWLAQPPSSSMRLAQATIPGDAGPGQLTVFYFGSGGGGGVDANIDRWIGQIEPIEGTPIRDTMSAGVNGELAITWVDVSGTLQPSAMGTGPTSAQPGWRLLGAVVEGAQGPWFFKATGPAETLGAQRSAFLDLMRSLELQP